MSAPREPTAGVGSFRSARCPTVPVVTALLTLAIAGLAPVQGRADFPERPVQVIVPFNPGGESDTFTRVIQAAIEKENLMPVPLVVLNVGGAGGTIGSRRAKNSTPDGYTILNLHDGILSAKLTGQADYGPEAFEPIAAVGQAASLVCVSDHARWNNLRALLDDAAAHPETIRFGANLGALSHFGALQLEQTTPGAAFRYVPTGGGAKRFGDLLGGHIDVTVFNAGEYDQFREGGIRALAILRKERHPAFPDVPTAVEQGVDAVRDSMQYFWAPKGTPRKRIAWFRRVLKKAMQSDYLQTRLADMKVDPIFITGPQLQLTLRRREQIMKGVRMGSTIALPNTPRLAMVVTLLLGVALVVHRVRGETSTAGLVQPRSADTEAPLSESDSSRTAFRRIGVALIGLLIFCGLFATSLLPFWLLSPVFIALLGLLMIQRTPKMIACLLITAWIVGPGCYLLFTKVLTIDLP